MASVNEKGGERQRNLNIGKSKICAVYRLMNALRANGGAEIPLKNPTWTNMTIPC